MFHSNTPIHFSECYIVKSYCIVYRIVNTHSAQIYSVYRHVSVSICRLECRKRTHLENSKQRVVPEGTIPKINGCLTTFYFTLYFSSKCVVMVSAHIKLKSSVVSSHLEDINFALWDIVMLHAVTRPAAVSRGNQKPPPNRTLRTPL